MKKIAAILVSGAVILGCAGCSSGVSRDEYDQVVSERDALQEQLEESESSSDVDNLPVQSDIASGQISDSTEMMSYEMKYDENNCCRVSVFREDDGLSLLGTCDFDGSDPELEAMRALAFTMVCGILAEEVSSENYSMMYLAGEENSGAAVFQDGELIVSTLPNTWEPYWRDSTNPEVLAEMPKVARALEKAE